MFQGVQTINREPDSNELVKKLMESADKEYFDVLEEIWGIQNPSNVLRECIKKEEWFKGVVLSATFFESVGAKVLSLRFGSYPEAEKEIAKKIENLSLDTIMILLYALKVIDSSTYLRMVGVNQYRNELVHKQSPFTKPEGKRSKRMIETAIECLHKLTYELHEERKEFLLKRKGK